MTGPAGAPTSGRPPSGQTLYTILQSLDSRQHQILRVLDEQSAAIAALSNALASLQTSVTAIAALIGGTAPETISNITFTVGPKP
jgi:hypothetical protein